MTRKRVTVRDTIHEKCRLGVIRYLSDTGRNLEWGNGTAVQDPREKEGVPRTSGTIVSRDPSLSPSKFKPRQDNKTFSVLNTFGVKGVGILALLVSWWRVPTPLLRGSYLGPNDVPGVGSTDPQNEGHLTRVSEEARNVGCGSKKKPNSLHTNPPILFREVRREEEGGRPRNKSRFNFDFVFYVL